ncbi:hypothetical protein HYU14_06390 [Candidatus Woesearchaeota archaeon]|nr:hypothetical protein [Candidatus Woesearchaeota archaeon]
MGGFKGSPVGFDWIVHLALPIKTDYYGKRFVSVVEVPQKEFDEFKDLALDQFQPSQAGMFGTDSKVRCLHDEWETAEGGVFAHTEDVRSFEHSIYGRKRELPEGIYKRFFTGIHPKSPLAVEIKRGPYTSISQELEADTKIKGYVDRIAQEWGLHPLYSGIELRRGTPCGDLHFHWNAGSLLLTHLTYLRMSNELWRIVAFSSNSPDINATGEVNEVNSRLGRTRVKELSLPFRIPLSEYDVPKGNGVEKYPMLINPNHGTLEIRVMDPDPRGSASVAYTYLILSAMVHHEGDSNRLNSIDSKTSAFNMGQAKRFGISKEGDIFVYNEAELAKVRIQDEMVRHYRGVIQPEIERLNAIARTEGNQPAIPEVLIREIEDRIINGNTPAKRVVDRYSRQKPEVGDLQARVIAQRLNLFSSESYFPS